MTGYKKGPREDQSCGGGGGVRMRVKDAQIPAAADVSPPYPKPERVEREAVFGY